MSNSEKRVRVKRNQSRKKHLFETDPEYLILYLDMLKQEKYWRTQGQYYMARECQRRAFNLRSEKIDEYNTYLKTENLYCPTKKSPFDCVK